MNFTQQISPQISRITRIFQSWTNASRESHAASRA
jgi:hypothetical protein